MLPMRPCILPLVFPVLFGVGKSQTLSGDYLHYYCGPSPNNLWTVQSPHPVTGTPQVIAAQSFAGPYTGCYEGYCNGGTYRDRNGFLWIVSDYYIAKLVPPPIPAGPQTVFGVDLLAGSTGDLGTPASSLVFDGNGDAMIITYGGGFSNRWRIVKIDHVTGVPTVFADLPSSNRPHWNLVVLDDGSNTQVLYGDGSSLRRLRRLGGQWVDEFVASFAGYYQVLQAPNGMLLVQHFYGSGHMSLIDPSNGTTVATYDSPEPSSEAVLVVPRDDHAEVWYTTYGAGYPGYPHRVLLRPDNSFTDGRSFTSIRCSGVHNITLDGRGRLLISTGTGIIYSNEQRDAFPGSLSLCTPVGPSFLAGDPNGLRRALTIDKLRDDDLDGYSNYEEVRLGSHPFDPSITPFAAPPTLHCTPSAPLGGNFTLTLGGLAGSGFLLATGAPSAQPISYPGLVGFLQLSPTSVSIFLASSPSLPISIPVSGRFQLTFGIPTNPVLSGMELEFQGVTWSSVPASTGFSNRASVLLL